MIVKDLYRRRLAGRERTAFTLLEVLVVVAILVVLASVASIYVFRYLEDSKKDKAYLQAKNIEKAYKSYLIKHTDDVSAQGLPAITVVVAPPDGGAPLLEGGSSALLDPWGKQYILQEIPSDTGDIMFSVQTTAPDGEVISSVKKR